MTTEEFSNEFDILYNNISSNLAPGLDEYEKSVFLTKALDELVKAYFNPTTVKTGQGFDDSTKRQYDFSTLIKTYRCPGNNVIVDSGGFISPTPIQHLEVINKIDFRSTLYSFPIDTFLVVNESLEFFYYLNTSGGGPKKIPKYTFSIIPVSNTNYTRIMLKPYHYPVKRGAWRLINGIYESSSIIDDDIECTGSTKVIEIIYRAPSDKTIINLPDYICRYVLQIPPIVLLDFSDTDLSIKGKKEKSECILPEECHPEILLRSIELAMAAYKGDLGSAVLVGNISSTDLGIAPRLQNNQ